MSLETVIVLCGGRGTRLGTDTEKPLVEVCGRSMVDRVCAALAASEINHVVAAVSPHAPKTEKYLRSGRSTGDVELIETPGNGYVEDLGFVLDRVETPVLTVAADLPLLTGSIVDSVLDSIESKKSTTVCVPVETKRSLGVSIDTSLTPEEYDRPLAPCGLNVVAEPGEEFVVRRDRALAVNVNRPRDLQIANVWCQR
ncbi:NTP transferase domain-containing protein [Halalkalirubrum salinum]|uniref:NTP transferase domain-containing protein n=1 Tax=Halalkalirubrum salinum TaxID=2563889 RepID=UPI001F0EBB78|nr:NTP transferase domain-containing protein [Halalkalirubrum salinum]